MIDENSHPTCDGCDKKGFYGVCKDCQTPDHEVEARNHNVRQPDGHNWDNRQLW